MLSNYIDEHNSFAWRNRFNEGKYPAEERFLEFFRLRKRQRHNKSIFNAMTDLNTYELCNIDPEDISDVLIKVEKSLGFTIGFLRFASVFHLFF